MPTYLDELATTVASIAASVTPSVVRLGGSLAANGIVIRPGQILTNAHNVRGSTIPVRFSTGRSADGAVAGVDPDGDLAVVSVDTADAPALPWSDAERLDIGEAVFAVTGTDSGPRVTFGLISGVARPFRGPRGRRIAGSIEHTAPMGRGSSGSALVNAAGHLVGLNTNRLEGGLYLALPTDHTLHGRVAALGQGDVPIPPRLGIGLAPAGAARRMRQAVGLQDRDGLLVRDVDPHGNAARAGITMGDFIVAADGRPVSDADDLGDILATTDGTVALTILRGADERVVPVDLT